MGNNQGLVYACDRGSEKIMQDKSKNLDESHKATMTFMFNQLEKTDAQIVASTMLAIAMRLYKTILKPGDFEQFVSVVSEESGEIEPFERPSIN